MTCKFSWDFADGKMQKTTGKSVKNLVNDFGQKLHQTKQESCIRCVNKWLACNVQPMEKQTNAKTVCLVHSRESIKAKFLHISENMYFLDSIVISSNVCRNHLQLVKWNPLSHLKFCMCFVQQTCQKLLQTQLPNGTTWHLKILQKSIGFFWIAQQW